MQIAVSAWSFHQALYAGKMRQVDVPGRVAQLGFMHVELLEMFLLPKPPGPIARLLAKRLSAPDPHKAQPDYGRQTLYELRSERLRAGARLACWVVDTDLTLANPEARKAQMARLATALEAARYLGAPLVRLTTGGQAGDVTGVKRATDMLRNVAVVAATTGLKLAVENHFGLSENIQVLADMVKAINHPNVGVCLDFGNFAEGQFKEGIRLLAPLANHVHAKSYAFDADGQETKIDYDAALRALGAAGYDGTISIEYEGEGDPVEGILATKTLIERFRKGGRMKAKG